MSPPPSTPLPRILCVDDRVSSLEVRRTMLSQLGYDVLIASEPPCALAILGKVEVDLVILDYSFPGHMTGEELARQIRAEKPDLPLIMLSGYPDLPNSARESVDVFVLKGAGGPTELLNAIAGLLHREPAQAKPPLKEQTRAMLKRSEELVQQSRHLKGRTEKAS